MKRVVVFLGAILLVATLLPSRLAPPIAASGTTFSFNLIGPNTAVNSSVGETIGVTGAGTFDPGAGTVEASGAFIVFNSAGAEVTLGNWKATAFNGFNAFGGPNPGTQGGVLEITATFFPNNGGALKGVPMSVTCLVNAPSGFTEDEGTTIADFTEKTGGTTLFHLED